MVGGDKRYKVVTREGVSGKVLLEQKSEDYPEEIIPG